ncbi:glycine cleavage system protein H [Thermodesulfobacteriota bacterium]
MDKKRAEQVRGRIGYGSSYRKGHAGDLDTKSEIGNVLGGQVWMIKPDRDAEKSNPCIWMQAGVAGFKKCNNFYDCTTCRYDRGMLTRVEQKKQMSWQDAMRRRPSLERICRHSLTNRIQRRACAYDYLCSKCDFDQYFEEVYTTKTASLPLDVQEIKGFEVPLDHYFHNGHTWVRIESGGNLRIGLDDFALKLLGRADGLDLPLMGKELHRDRAGWGLKRDNHQADVLAPVDGVIMDVNAKVRENPELANREPYGEGWLFTLRTPDPKKAMKELMGKEESPSWMNSEVSRLENMVEDVAGPLAADGGYLNEDIYGNLPKLGWKKLVKNFLKTG